MRRNGYLWIFGVNLDTAFRSADRDFLLECKISAIWWRFPLIFCILYAECPPYFYFRGRLTYWPRKYTTRVDPHVDNSRQVWSWHDHIHCRVIAFLSDTSHDLVTLTFGLLTLNMSCMASHVTNTGTKYEDPTPIRSWVMRWSPLKKRTRLPRMRRITWPVSRGSKKLHFGDAWPRFAYSLCNFDGSTMNTIKVNCENNARPCV